MRQEEHTKTTASSTRNWVPWMCYHNARCPTRSKVGVRNHNACCTIRQARPAKLTWDSEFYLSKFISNLTKKTHRMHSLLKRDIHFVWTNDMQKELNIFKEDITNSVKLIHYDLKKASSHGDCCIDERFWCSPDLRWKTRALSQQNTNTCCEANYSNLVEFY